MSASQELFFQIYTTAIYLSLQRRVQSGRYRLAADTDL